MSNTIRFKSLSLSHSLCWCFGLTEGFDSTEFYQDFSSSFKYLLPWSELVDVKDFNGAVRFFKNTRTNVDAEEAFDDALDGISEGVTRDGDMLRAMRSMNKLKGPRLRRSAPTLLGYAEPACTLFAIGAS